MIRFIMMLWSDRSSLIYFDSGCNCQVLQTFAKYVQNVPVFFLHFRYHYWVSWIKVCGTSYSKASVIVTALTRGNPPFGQFADIFVADGDTVLFYYEKLDVIQHVNHLNAYEVQHSNTFGYVRQKDIADYHALSIHEGFGTNSKRMFVVLNTELIVYWNNCKLN